MLLALQELDCSIKVLHHAARAACSVARLCSGVPSLLLACANKRCMTEHALNVPVVPTSTARTLTEVISVVWAGSAYMAMHLALGAEVRSDNSSMARTSVPCSFILGLCIDTSSATFVLLSGATFSTVLFPVVPPLRCGSALLHSSTKMYRHK